MYMNSGASLDYFRFWLDLSSEILLAGLVEFHSSCYFVYFHSRKSLLFLLTALRLHCLQSLVPYLFLMSFIVGSTVFERLGSVLVGGLEVGYFP